MKKFRLNNQSCKFIQTDTGMDCKFISESDISVVDSNIEAAVGLKLKPSLAIGNLTPRGSVYLMFKRFLTESFINGQLSKIKA